MSARHAIAELAAVWRRLPALVGSQWPELRARLMPEIEALVTAETDRERHRCAGRVLRPLMSRPGVWNLLNDAFKSEVTRASDPAVADEASWPALAGLLNAAARDQWINAVFGGHPPGSPFAAGRPYVLAFTIDDFAHAEAFKAAQLDVLVEDAQESAELRVDVLSENAADAEVRAISAPRRPSRRCSPRSGHGASSIARWKGRMWETPSLRCATSSWNGTATSWACSTRPAAKERPGSWGRGPADDRGRGAGGPRRRLSVDRVGGRRRRAAPAHAHRRRPRRGELIPPGA